MKRYNNKSGVIHIYGGGYHAAFSTVNADRAVDRIKSELNRGVHKTFPVFNKMTDRAVEVSVSVYCYCEKNELRYREFELKQRLAKRGVNVVNPDVIQYKDCIVPFRYIPLFRELIRKLENHEITEDHFKALLNVRI